MKKYLPIIGLLLFSYVVRLPHLNGSFWLDEAAQVLESKRPLAQQHKIAQDFQPPLLHYIVHFMLYVSSNEWWLRQVSVLSGVATVVIVYALVQQSHTKKIAIVSAVLLSTSSFHIFFSQELRPYSLATVWAALSWYALTKSMSTRNVLYNTLYVVVSLAGLYSMYLYPFVLGSQILYVCIQQKTFVQRYVRMVFLIFLGGLPWVIPFFEQLHVGRMLQSQLPGWSQAVAVPQMKALPLTLAKFFIGQVELSGDPIRIGLTAIPIIVLLWSMIFAWKEQKNRLYIYWFVIPLLGAWLLSFFIPVIAPKRLMISLPAMWIVLAIALNSSQRRIHNLLLTLLLLVNVFTTGMYYTVERFQREDWRTLIQRIESSALTNSAAVFSFPDPFAPWVLYSKGTVRAISTEKLFIASKSELPSSITQLQATKVYVFAYLQDLTDPQKTVHASLKNQGYKEIDQIDGKQIGFVSVFSR